MGLISDRKSRTKREKEAAAVAAAAAAYNKHMNLHNFHPSRGVKQQQQQQQQQLQQQGHPRGVYGPKVLPTNVPQKYPAGYYTTPASWSSHHHHHQHHNHNQQPKSQPNVDPRYQTWVAPSRKQPSLGQLVRLHIRV